MCRNKIGQLLLPYKSLGASGHRDDKTIVKPLGKVKHGNNKKEKQ
jgi:hypothetical protein